MSFKKSLNRLELLYGLWDGVCYGRLERDPVVTDVSIVSGKSRMMRRLHYFGPPIAHSREHTIFIPVKMEGSFSSWFMILARSTVRGNASCRDDRYSNQVKRIRKGGSY